MQQESERCARDVSGKWTAEQREVGGGGGKEVEREGGTEGWPVLPA